MRKFVFILFTVIYSATGMYAMNLREAYNALSKLPNVSTAVNDTIAVSINKNTINTGTLQVARAFNLDREEIKACGDATFAVLNQIPLSYMINGGNNGYVGAFVYCMSNESGTNDMLIVTMSGEQGDLTYLYVTDLDENDKLCIQEAKLIMQGSSLSIIPCQPDGFIGAIKVNCK